MLHIQKAEKVSNYDLHMSGNSQPKRSQHMEWWEVIVNIWMHSTVYEKKLLHSIGLKGVPENMCILHKYITQVADFRLEKSITYKL